MQWKAEEAVMLTAMIAFSGKVRLQRRSHQLFFAEHDEA
jgi:hypothetical protein